LSEAALAMGRSLMKEVVSIVKPETILSWQRRLEQKKWDYSGRRCPPHKSCMGTSGRFPSSLSRC